MSHARAPTQGGETIEPGLIGEFLKTIDCYVMGSHTHETALNFEAKGAGWVYGPILIREGIPFFLNLNRDIPLHLAEVKAYRSGMVELRYEVRNP